MLPTNAKYVLNTVKSKKMKLITSERNNPSKVNNKRTKKIKNKVFLKSDGIIFQTQRAMDFYPEIIRKKGVVIHNAVGNDLVYDAPIVKTRANKITAIGRLDRQKDYPCLLNAFKNVLEKHPDFILEIFGEGADKSKLEILTKDLNISNNVKFMGAHRDAILKAADSACYVMSSKFEGMPNALMEAMAIGLPCVSTDCPNGPKELITNGENGLLVPVGNEKALSDAILKMIEDKDFAEKCGNNARRILDTHSIEIKAKEYKTFIEKVYNEE
jgi:glycosyltransferase involved in cell wall biosynthesis